MLKKVIFILILFLFIIPFSFASNDNATGEVLNTQGSDIYFDINASDDKGDGSVDNPYKYLRDGRILDNSIIHLSNGEYNLYQLNTHKNITIQGQNSSKTIIKGSGGALIINSCLVLSNITINSLNIFNQGDLTANNVIFSNSKGLMTGNYGESFGGAIYCVDFTNNAYLTNCTFINNSAKYGGAIYLNSGILELTNCIFVNNTAECYGGSIACDAKAYSKPRVNIKNSTFNSIKSATGAIYIKTGNITLNNLNFTNCKADFGSSIVLLNTNSILNNIHAFNNTAVYDGGVIYQIHGNLTLVNSSFTQNTALNGAGLFTTNADNITVINNIFINNTASLKGGAYCLISNNNTILNNNTFHKSTQFNQSKISLIVYSGNYSLFSNSVISDSLPSYYNSVYAGYVSSVKDQETGGNCWAFASIGTLESAILKASGINLDLSEENMKNIAALYSYYGWLMDTNNGGYDDMGIGYLTSWFGPILESGDEYNSKVVLSPLLESILHVQNILYLKKSNNNDLNHIKKAIMDYGAVYAGIYMCAYYDSAVGSYVQYYNGANSCDHSVVIVGWDDDFYIPNAPGRGAWIVKNSWGSNWGDNGYFYVSYFDKTCPKLNENDGAIAFILNDTIKFDKNYQYDVAKTDYFLNTTSTVWYKNIFTATDNEYLTAVSTYFEKETSWELSVYVNNVLKSTKSGKSPSSYSTIMLDDFISLNIGDVFEVIFKINVDGDAGVPISEIVSLNNYFYTSNISFISYDGANWSDLYELKWEYPDHTYSSQVACIKAFTILNPINTTLNLVIQERNSQKALIKAEILNEYGYKVNNGNVTFTFNNENYTVKVIDGEAYFLIDLVSTNLEAKFAANGYFEVRKTAELSKNLINTNITLQISSEYNPINITARILDDDLNPVNEGVVIFQVEDKNYTVDVVNGFANLTNINLSPLTVDITANFNDLFKYNSSSDSISLDVKKRPTRLLLDVDAPQSNNPVNVTAVVFDEFDNPLNQGEVLFNFSGIIYRVEIQNYRANFIYTFPTTGLHNISAYYFDEYQYGSFSNSTQVNVSKMKVNLTLSSIIDENTAVLGINIKNATRGFEILAFVGDKNYTYQATEGSVIVQLNDLDNGTYNYSFRLISPIYEANDLNGEFNISYIKTNIIAKSTSIYYNGVYSVVFKDIYGNPLENSDIYLKIGSKIYKNRTNSQGLVIFNLKEDIGTYYATISFIGDDEYIKSSTNSTITIKSTIISENYIYTFNSKYSLTIRDSNGSLVVNKAVKIVLNGNTYNLITDSYGKVSLNINLQPESYIVEINNYQSGEVKYHFIEIIKRITSNKNVEMYWGASKVYKVRVCGDNGEHVKNLKVTFKVNGKTYHAFTDSKGYASFKINLKPSVYTIIASYNGYQVTNKIKVKTTLITKNINVKKGKSIKFTAKLLNSNGKIIKNKKITFKFKSKTYKIKTNKKGIATLKITKKYNIGKYTITTKYSSLSNKNKIVIKK